MVVKKLIRLKIKKNKFSTIVNHFNNLDNIILATLDSFKFLTMTDIRQKKENVKMHLKDLRQNLKKMHLEVTEELILPKPEDVKKLMNKMDELLKLIESK